MTYEELTKRIQNFGFEEDHSMKEMESVVITGINAAQYAIYETVVYPNRRYFESLDEDVEEPTSIVRETPKDFEIELPDKVVGLLPLLASYYIWLDDEPTKAATYKNEYEDLKELLQADMSRPIKLVFGKGGI